MINAVLDIKLLAPEEWHVLRTIRLRALLDSPHAFMSVYETEAQWARSSGDNGSLRRTGWSAVESGAIIGIAGLVDGYASDGLHVEWTWVDPAHRHRGIFRALLKVLIDLESGNGAYDVALWVLENNSAARTAYARLGFAPTGERQRLSDGRYELRLRLPIMRRS